MLYPNRFWKNGRNILALIYFAYAILPHTQLFTHSHSGSQTGHQHAFLTGHDAALEREALTAISGNVETMLVESHSEEISKPVVNPLEQGTKGFEPTGSAHQHVTQNSTLPVVGTGGFARLACLSLLELPGLRPVFIPDRPALNPSARGPPVFSC